MHTSSCGKGVRKDGLVLQDGQDEIDKRIQSCWYNPMRSERRGSLRLASPRLSLVPQRGWRTVGIVTVGSETIRVEDEGSSITHVGISADRDLTVMHQGPGAPSLYLLLHSAGGIRDHGTPDRGVGWSPRKRPNQVVTIVGNCGQAGAASPSRLVKFLEAKSYGPLKSSGSTPMVLFVGGSSVSGPLIPSSPHSQLRCQENRHSSCHCGSERRLAR